MTTILITRHYTTQNMADQFSLGNHEHEGNAATSEYELPEGYSGQDGRVYDPAGFECAIVAGQHNRPTLMSRAGDCADAVLAATQ